MSEFEMRRAGGRPIQLEPRQIFALVWGAAGVIVVLWGVFTSFYTVEASEEAVILRFGRFHTIEGPGFHGKLPFGIDKVLKGEVKTVHREEFGYRTTASGVQSQFDYTSRRSIAEATKAKLVQSVEEEIHREFDREVPSQEVGRRVAALLREIDEIAYIRYASEYYEFRTLDDLAAELKELRSRVRNLPGQIELFSSDP